MLRWVITALSLIAVIPSSPAQRLSTSLRFQDTGVSKGCGTISYPDSAEAARILHKCLTKYQGRGYLGAYIDSIAYSDRTIQGYAVLGPRYRWASISTDSTSEVWLNRAGVNTQKALRKPVSPKFIASSSQRTLYYLENNGYPFAKLVTDNSSIDSNMLSVTLSVVPGPLITLDTLYILGDARITRRFIESHLLFQKGILYNNRAIRGYSRQLSSLQFIQEARPPEVEFIPNRARLYLYLTNRRANQLSGIVGFSNESDSDDKWAITGDFNLLLHNSLGRGERMHIRWEAPGQGTQRLNLEATWFYLAGSRIGLDGLFALFKRDSSYLNLNPRLTVNFQLSPSTAVGVGLEYRQSTVILSAAQHNLSNFSTTLYHVSVSKDARAPVNLNRAGFFGEGFIGVGPKSVTPMGIQPQTQRYTHYEAKGWVGGIVPILPRWVSLKSLIHGGAMRTQQGRVQVAHHLDNELFLIGGSRILRGFNQDQIMARTYCVATGEAHLLLSNTSSVFVFYDQGMVESVTPEGMGWDWPSGLGVGMTLRAGNGLLNLTYALGNGYGQAYRLRDAKVHIGYMAWF